MVTDNEMYNIGKYGIPKEYHSCPSCGQVYGHHKTKVCMICQECSKCCKEYENCKMPDYQPAEVAINKILSGEDESWSI